MIELDIDYISNQNYYDFIHYCINNSSAFMLVYVDYCQSNNNNRKTEIKNRLKKYEMKKRNDPKWPGTILTELTGRRTVEIIFYKSCEEVKEVLMSVDNIFSWTRPDMPEDLAFFKGNKCWFYSTAHEELATLVEPSKEDIGFFEKINCFNEKKIYEVNYNAFVEEGLGST